MALTKGIVYTLIAMILISLFVTSYYYAFKTESYVFDPSAYVVRGYQLSQTLKTFESDFKRAMVISGRRALLEIVRNETDTGTYLSNIDKLIIAYSYRGTGLVENSTLSDWLKAFGSLTSNYKINSSFHIINGSVGFYDSYSPDHLLSLNYVLNLEIFIKDEIFGSYYLLNESFQTPLRFEDIEDPYLSLESAGYVRQVYALCEHYKVNVSSHDYFWGYAYKSLDTDLSYVSDKESKVLVTDTLTGKQGYDGFRGYVLEDYYVNSSLSNYVADIRSLSARIKDNSLIVVSDDELWITKHFADYTNASCYFRWDKGINILDRLEGNKTYDPVWGIATFVPTASLPAYLVYTTDPMVIDSEYF